MAIHNPLTGYEPNLLDNFDHSESSATIFQDESGDIETEPSYSCDAELDDEIMGKANLITLMKRVCCQLSPFSHTQVRGDPCANLVRLKNEDQVATWKTKE